MHVHPVHPPATPVNTVMTNGPGVLFKTCVAMKFVYDDDDDVLLVNFEPDVFLWLLNMRQNSYLQTKK